MLSRPFEFSATACRVPGGLTPACFLPFLWCFSGLMTEPLWELSGPLIGHSLGLAVRPSHTARPSSMSQRHGVSLVGPSLPAPPRAPRVLPAQHPWQLVESFPSEWFISSAPRAPLPDRAPQEARKRTPLVRWACGFLACRRQPERLVNE